MRVTTIALGVAAALAIAGAAGAHPGYGPGGFGPGHGMGPDAGRAVAGEDRLAVLKSRLNITPAQEAAWNAFAAKAKAQSDAMLKLREKMWANPPATLEERSARHNEMLKERLAQSESMGAAVKDLSAALTAEQRAVLDRGGPMGYGYGRGGFGPGGRFR